MSATTPLYLRHDVQVEPLIDQWYAWSHLLAPATYARNVTHRHLPIMDSFVAAPEVHAAAVVNPRMRGGPFIDHPASRVNDIRALRDRTRRERPHILALSKALEELNALLISEAKGGSLQMLYPRVPEILRGYVELSYDLNNQPSYRILESLLFRSEFQSSELQSLALSLVSGDERPFVLSTPRLDDDGNVQLKTPFNSDTVDRLFRLKSEPQPLSRILDSLPCPDTSRPTLCSFLTPDRPAPYERYDGRTARWRYFGHACVLIETPRTSILFDPVLSYTYESVDSRYTYADLPDVIDYLVITHNHQDHVLLETLVQLRCKVRHVIVPFSTGTLQDPSLRLTLRQVGFQSVIELDELEEVSIDNGSIVALPFLGEHCDLTIRTKSAYLVRIGRHSLIFAADSCNIEPRMYEHLRRDIGPIDALFIGMECVGAPLTWLYGPLLTTRIERAHDQSRRLNGSDFDQAMQIVNTFGCREVYVYAMGQEPWLNHVMSIRYTESSRPIVESNRLIAACRERGIAAERLFGEKEMFLAD